MDGELKSFGMGWEREAGWRREHRVLAAWDVPAGPTEGLEGRTGIWRAWSRVGSTCQLREDQQGNPLGQASGRESPPKG